MFFRKRGVPLKRRRQRSRNVSVRDMFQIISSLILPFLLGAFTVFVTMDQRRLARIDRHEDKNESRQQRKQEWDIAVMKQDAQYKVATDRYQDEILVAYVNQIGDLLKENNGSLTTNHLIATLARVKTLNAFRQLDGSRKTHVLRFLHESGQLATAEGSIPLDVRGAKLNNIDFNESSWSDSIREISLSGVRLLSCKFPELHPLVNVNFGSTLILNVTFSLGKLFNVNISSAEIRDTNLSFARLDRVNFSFSKFIRTNCTSSKLTRVNFTSAELFRVNFSNTEFVSVNFSSAELTNVNFSSAKLAHVDFSLVQFGRVNFSSALLTNVSFAFAELNFVDFSSSRLAFEPSNFHYANMTRTKFLECDCEMANFSYAYLPMSEFMNANLKNASFQNANLTRVNFTLANLWNTDLTNTTITDEQLHSALSIRNAKLPNGTLGHTRNLIRNGKADCKTRLIDPWDIPSDHIAVKTSNENRNDCHFVLKSNINEATMWQRISLVNVWDPTIWTYSSVELHLSGSSGISFELNGLENDGTMLHKEVSTSTKNEITMELQKDMQQLEVIVKFNVQTTKEYTWCDNIELFINYQMAETTNRKGFALAFGPLLRLIGRTV